MTELETYRPQQSGDIAAWSSDFATVAGIAGQLATTNFVPQSLRVFRNNGKDYDAAATAAQVAAAILTGRELGLDPMAALRSIDVIQGTPALRAIALRGILQAQGHHIWVEEATNNRATVAGQRKDSDHIQRLTWTMDDAKSRGLTGKSNWRSQPRNMLIARCTADVARMIAADAILGLPYSAEELEDGDSNVPPPGVPPVPAAGPRKARRAITAPTPPAATVADEPPLDDPSSPVEKPEAAPEPADEPPLDDPDEEADITEPQKKMMFALMHEQNFIDRDDRLAFVTQTLGRDVTSSSDLTVTEASAVIDALRTLPPIA